MHATPSLTPAALDRWQRMPDRGKELILSRIWCGRCGAGGEPRNMTGELHPSGDIILRGECSVCGGPVCRVIETGETMGPPESYP